MYVVPVPWCTTSVRRRVVMNTSDRTRPMMPTTMSTTPTVFTLTPVTCLVTANLRIAPTAIRKRLAPMRMAVFPSFAADWGMRERLRNEARREVAPDEEHPDQLPHGAAGTVDLDGRHTSGSTHSSCVEDRLE